MLNDFKTWLNLNEMPDIAPGTVPPERQPQNVNAGIGDKIGRNNPMRKQFFTAAFPTYSLPGSDPLPGNKKLMKKK